MRIAIDLRPLQLGHQNRGIGAYLLNLLQEMPTGDEHTYIFIRYSKNNPIEEYDLGKGRNYVEVQYKQYKFSRQPLNMFLYVWTNLFPSFARVRRYRPDVYFQTDYLLGAPRGGRVVTMSYDLIPLRLKSIYLPSWKKFVGYRNLRLKSRARFVFHALFYQLKYKNSYRLLKRSKKVLSISENTSKDLIELLGISEKKIKTVYGAPSFRHSEKDKVIRYKVKKLVDDIKIPYIVYIGATDRRRQVAELVHAFNLYNAFEKPIGLLLCGNEFRIDSKSLDQRAKDAVLKSSYNDNIHLMGRISEAEKSYILEHAAAFVFPTLYEGFGIPILEAMHSSCPVITYNNSSIPEIGGDAVIYTEKYGGESIYQSLAKLLSNSELQEKSIKRGLLQAKKFSWRETSDDVWSTLLKSSQ